MYHILTEQLNDVNMKENFENENPMQCIKKKTPKTKRKLQKQQFQNKE